MDTPIKNFIDDYAVKNPVRMHMPGHKGRALVGAKADITEVNGADVLYLGDGIIAKSQANASQIFGTKKTLYSTEGSSLSIRAIVYLLCAYAKEKNRACKILAGRNAHKVFSTAVGLCDAKVDWLYPKESEGLNSCNITAVDIDEYLSSCNEKPIALYITSPSYVGNIADVENISKVCKKHDVLLVVDNAHGAYLKFLQKSLHPIDLGADICCDSAHKTLCALTGAGYLHISNDAPEFFSKNAEHAMTLFASTSPSYLILNSLDSLNPYLFDGYKDSLYKVIEKSEILKTYLKSIGYNVLFSEPLKIVIKTKSYGYKGYEIAEILEKRNIVCEFSDPDYLVLMLSDKTTENNIERVKSVLSEIEKRQAIKEEFPPFTKPEKVLEIRKALFETNEEIDAKDSLGRVLASPTVSCPPAIPILMSGEKIDEDCIKNFSYYGIEKVRVIK